MKTGKFSYVALFVLYSAVLQAADFQVSASLDRNQISLNEQAVLSLTISGSGGDFPQPQLPGLSDFQIYNAGRSQSFTWINGKAMASLTYNYVITPLKEGRFTIPAIRIQAQGQTADTAPLTLDVVKGDASATGAGVAHEEGSARPAQAARGPAAVFITGTVDKTSVYVGEPIIFTFRFYNRVALLSRPGYQPPEMTGFWTEDLPPQRNFQTTVKGIPYNVIEIRTALFPTAPGKSRVGAATLTVNLENFGTDPFGSDFFAQFFGRGETKTLRTDPVAVTVRALPEPKPADFNGAVGQYSLNAQVDKETIAVGQPLTLTLTISGKGNIKSLPSLPVPTLTNFRTFDANAATNVEKKEGEVSGTKVFKTVLIPTASGEVTIPSIPFSFFDPASRSYRKVQSRPITVHVTPGSAVASPVIPYPMASDGNPTPSQSPAPGIKMLGEDIRYIRTPTTLMTQSEPLYRQTWYRGLHFFIAALLIAGGAVRLYFLLFLSNPALYRFRKAHEKAQAEIAKTEEYLTKNDIKGAGSHLADILQDFLSAKLGIGNRTVALKDIVERLKTRGLLAHTGEKVRNIWETLDLYQFAPAQVQAAEVRSSKDTMKHVIEEVEREITWKQ
jgi:hypothetical protein